MKAKQFGQKEGFAGTLTRAHIPKSLLQCDTCCNLTDWQHENTCNATLIRTFMVEKKVQVGIDQDKAQSEKKPTPKTKVGKKKQTNNQALIP